jgi:hypothetical protein
MAIKMVVIVMDSKKDIIVGQIKQQISLTGIQVKQRMKDVQLELLKELSDEQDGTKGIEL